MRGFLVRALFLTFPLEKTTFQLSKVVSEAIFPTNQGYVCIQKWSQISFSANINRAGKISQKTLFKPQKRHIFQGFHEFPKMKIQNVCNLHLRKFVNIASRVADTIYLHPLIGGHHCQLDNQCRDPMNNNKDCRVGQLTTSAGSTSVERFPQDNSCNVLFLSFRFLTIVHDVGAICAEWHRVLYLNGQKLPYGPPP